MTEYVISDTHAYHANIIRYCNRPFKDVPEMNGRMIYNWNSVVTPNDIVYHVGDVSFGKKEDLRNFVQCLNGHKILIMGNHDRQKSIMRWAGFEDVLDSLILERNGYRFLLHHYPWYDVPPPGIDRVIHGHIHNTIDESPKYHKCNVNVSVEMINYTPIPLLSLLP
jgi:calcineurin-like phosphoesterase family protein